MAGRRAHAPARAGAGRAASVAVGGRRAAPSESQQAHAASRGGLLELQRTAGNAAVQRAVGGGLLSVGSRGPRVAALQQALNGHGASLTADGIFGPATRAAVVAFQRANGLGADGVVGPKTQAALGGAPPVEAEARPAMPPEVLAKLSRVTALLRERARPTTVEHRSFEPIGHHAGHTEVQRDFFDDVSDAVGGAVDAVGDAASGVADVATDVGNAVVDGVSGAAGAVADAVGGAVDAVSGAVAGAVDAVSGAAGEVVDAVTGAVGQVVDGVQGAVEEGVDAVTQAVTAVAGGAQELLDQAGEQVGELLGPLAAPLREALAGLGRGHRPDVGSLGALLDQVIAALDPALATAAGGKLKLTGSTTFDRQPGKTEHKGTLEEAAASVSGQKEAGSAAITPSFTTVTMDDTVIQLDVVYSHVVTIPKWVDRTLPDDADLAAKQEAEWARFEAAVAAHEEEHVEIDKKALADNHLKGVGKHKDKVGAALQVAETAANAANAKHDKTTDHGRKSDPSTKLSINLNQVIKVPATKKKP